MSRRTRSRKPRVRAATARATAAPDRKLSISLDSDDVQWVKRRAKYTGTSVSAVIGEAIAARRRAEARAELLEQLGTDDITDAELAAVRREAFGE